MASRNAVSYNTVLGGGGGGGFSDPTSVAGLSLWLDPTGPFYTDAGITQTTTNNAVVYRWADKSGLGNHADQSSAGVRPTLKNNFRGSRSGVLFNGSNRLIAPCNGGAYNQFAMFIVMQHTDRQVFSANAVLGMASGGPVSFISGGSMRMGGTDKTAIADVTDFDYNTWLHSYVSAPTFIDYKRGTLSFNPSGTYSATGGPFTSLYLGCTESQVNNLKATVLEVLIYTSALSAQNVADITSYLNTKYTLPEHPTAGQDVIIIEGDSISRGNFIAAQANTWPILSKSAFPAGHLLRNWAVNATTFNSSSGPKMDTRIQYVKNDILAANGSTTVLVWAGTNDIAAAPTATGATTFTRLQTYCNLIKADAAAKGTTVKIGIMTMLPRNSVETERTAYNTAIRNAHTVSTADAYTWKKDASNTWSDFMIDVGNTATTMGGVGANTNATYYNGDQIHPIVAGDALIAAQVQTSWPLI